MKKLFFLFCFIGVSAVAMAQNKSIDRIFDKYAGKEGFTTVFISKYMFSMFANLEGIDDKELKETQEVFGKLTGIKILAVEDSKALGPGVNFYDEIMKDLPRDQYEELMTVKNSESDVVFLAREDHGVIVELLLIVGGEGDENVLIAITGQIDLNTIAKLSKTMDIEGMEELENLEERK
jgi:hypothetical protein